MTEPRIIRKRCHVRAAIWHSMRHPDLLRAGGRGDDAERAGRVRDDSGRRRSGGERGYDPRGAGDVRRGDDALRHQGQRSSAEPGGPRHDDARRRSRARELEQDRRQRFHDQRTGEDFLQHAHGRRRTATSRARAEAGSSSPAVPAAPIRTSRLRETAFAAIRATASRRS